MEHGWMPWSTPTKANEGIQLSIKYDYDFTKKSIQEAVEIDSVQTAQVLSVLSAGLCSSQNAWPLLMPFNFQLAGS